MASKQKEFKPLILIGISDFTGASKMGYNLACAFQRANIPVVVASPPRISATFGGAKDYPSVNDALEKKGFAVSVIHGMERLASWPAIRSLADVIKREKVTVILDMHQNTVKYAAAASLLTGVPHVSYRQGPVIFGGSSLGRRLKKLLMYPCLKWGTSLCVVQNLPHRQQLINEFGVQPQNISIVESGIDLQLFEGLDAEKRAAARAEFGIADNEILLINVGRLDSQKNQADLLESFRVVREAGFPAKVLFIGNVTAGAKEAEDYAQKLYDFVKAKHLQDFVIFAGWRNDIPRLLNAADVYVQSSVWEGFPLVMSEAMATRLPFIGTLCFGMPPGFVQGETGFLVPPNSVKDLTTAMLSFLRMSKEERRRLGEQGRRFVEQHHDIHALSNGFVELLVNRYSS